MVTLISMSGLGLLCCDRNHSPEEPTLLFPTHEADSIEIPVTFRWSCVDPDGDKLSYSLRIEQDGKTKEFKTSQDSIVIDDLEELKNYRWQVIADDGELSEFSTTFSFTTSLCKAPTVLTDSLIVYPEGKAEMWGHAIGTFVPGEVSFGFCVAFQSSNSLSEKNHYCGHDGNFHLVLDSVQKDGKISIKAFSIKGNTVSYGHTKSEWTPPIVITKAVYFDENHIHCWATATSSFLEIYSKGFCYAMHPKPTYGSDSCKIVLGGYSYSCDIGNLDSESTYFIRSFIITKLGVHYGEEQTAVCPTCCFTKVKTIGVTEISPYDAILVGEFETTCDPKEIAKGFYIGTTPELQANGQRSWVRSDSLQFRIMVGDLVQNQTYYFAACVSTDDGILIGTIQSFTVPEGPLRLKHNKEYPPWVHGTYEYSLFIDVDGDAVNDLKFIRQVSTPLGAPWSTSYYIESLGNGFYVNFITTKDTTYNFKTVVTIDGSPWDKKVAILDTTTLSCRKINPTDKIFSLWNFSRPKVYARQELYNYSGDWTDQRLYLFPRGGTSISTIRKENADTVWLSTTRDINDCHSYHDMYLGIKRIVDGKEKLGWIKVDDSFRPSESEIVR
jgi:hypothetical protein